MAQIIQDAPGFGEILGTGLGQGLGGSLQNLANMKLNQFAQRQQAVQTAKAFQQLPGVTPEIAQFLAALSPEERKYPLQNLGSLMQLGQALGPQAAQHVQPQSGMEALQGLSAADLLSNPSQSNPLLQQALSKAPLKPQMAAQPQQKPIAQDQAKLVEDIFTSPQEKRERHKIALKEKQIANQEKSERFKASQKDRKEIIDKAKSSRQQLHDLERMEELEKSGKLDTPGYVEFLKRSGLDIPALMNPESQEFQKIAVGFLRDAKAYFGARISNYELEQFLKSIPSLSQSPSGRKSVISNLKYLQRGNLAYNEALKEIMKENEGIPPYDLLEQIDDRIDPKLDKIAERFKQEIAKPAPQAQNRLVTALQTTLGDIVGGLGSLAKGAATGAGIGALKYLL